MEFENKKLRDVAEIAARIMLGQQPVTEKLHPNQQKLDVHEPEKDELTSDDFKKLRAGKKAEVKKEEVEVDEAYDVGRIKSTLNAKPDSKSTKPDSKSPMTHSTSLVRSTSSPGETVLKTTSSTRKLPEDVEQIDEVKMADLPSRKIQGRSYGASKPEPHAVDTLRGPKEKELKDIETEKKKKKFSEMVDVYKTGGLKSFMESIPKEDELIDELSKEIADYTMDVIDAGEYAEVTIGEEASQDEFNAEIKKAQAKSEGKEKAQVAKPFVQAVKQEETEITDEMIFEMIEEAGIDFESLSDEQFQNVANEAYEILDELSKNTLGSYIKKANYAGGMADFKHGRIADRRGDSKEKTALAATSTKRTKGISTAVNKLSKEEVEQVDERQMTDSEMEKKEKIVKSMKKGLSGFKDRYGDKAKNVMYATATKQAMK